MGFRGSRVQIPPSRLSEDQALQRLLLWGFFFVLPHAVSNAVSFYRLTIRCVGCSTTFLIVSASACWYEVVSTFSVFQPPASGKRAARPCVDARDLGARRPARPGFRTPRPRNDPGARFFRRPCGDGSY